MVLQKVLTLSQLMIALPDSAIICDLIQIFIEV